MKQLDILHTMYRVKEKLPVVLFSHNLNTQPDESIAFAFHTLINSIVLSCVTNDPFMHLGQNVCVTLSECKKQKCRTSKINQSLTKALCTMKKNSQPNSN